MNSLEWLFSATDYEQKKNIVLEKRDLVRMRMLLDALGRPWQKVKCVHVAGTKGKGSTCLFLERMLLDHGYTVVTTMSPHLEDLNERIRINGLNISGDHLERSLGIVRNACESVELKGVTFFEAITATAWVVASEINAVIILETGLGGRFDATRICNPTCTAITSISLDHVAALGSTLESIAFEKCGIIKYGIPNITGAEMDPGALKVICDQCRYKRAPLEQVEISEDLLKTLKGDIRRISNFLVAFKLFSAITGINPDMNHLKELFYGTILPGRMEMFEKGNHMVLLDCAHNQASFDYLFDTTERINWRQTILVMGIAADKEWKEIARKADSCFSKIYFCNTGSPRSLKYPDLQEHIHSFDNLSHWENCSDWKVALKSELRQGNRIVIAGSFYLSGVIRKWLKSEGFTGKNI